MTSEENRAFFVGHPVPLIHKRLYKYICKRFSFDMDNSEFTNKKYMSHLSTYGISSMVAGGVTPSDNKSTAKTEK